MRYWEIYMFVFMINVTLALMLNLGVFQTAGQIPPDSFIYNFQQQANSMNSVLPKSTTGLDAFALMIWGMYQGLAFFVSTFFQATVLVYPMILNLMGCSILVCSTGIYQVAILFSGIVYFIYITALIQLIINRKLEKEY